ncbi:MAG: hypothetical protein ABSA65_09235 [Acidimicrobiales bacterium]|jgi:hypothetical protein
MNGYVEAGYVVVLGTLSTYGVTLVARERAARRRLGAAPNAVPSQVPAESQELTARGDVSLVKRRDSGETERGTDS